MRASNSPVQPTGVQLVMSDAFAHPDSSITEITARTGLRQSHVSVAVAELREQGILETRADPRDGRRTLVRVSDEHPRRVVRAGSVSVDPALERALNIQSSDDLSSIVDQLESLAQRVRPVEPGPIAREL